MNAEKLKELQEILKQMPKEHADVIADCINHLTKNYDELKQICEESQKQTERVIKIYDDMKKLYEKAEPYYIGSFGGIKLPFGFMLMKPEYKYEKEKKE